MLFLFFVRHYILTFFYNLIFFSTAAAVQAKIETDAAAAAQAKAEAGAEIAADLEIAAVSLLSS